jgi:VWFA-related protein
MQYPEKTRQQVLPVGLDSAKLKLVAREGETRTGQNIPIANPYVYTSIEFFAGVSEMLSMNDLENMQKVSARIYRKISEFSTWTRAGLAPVLCLALFANSVQGWAQSGSQSQGQPGQTSSTPSSQIQDSGQTQDNGKPKQDVPADAGGPGDSVPYAIPKKKADEPPPPPPPPKRTVPEDNVDYSLKVNVPLVNVDVMVTSKDGQFVPGLKQENFRILEDGVPQTVTNFGVTKAPITAVLLVEFAATNYVFMIQALQASYTFANTLQKNDWVAVSYYDMQPHILVDFTQDKKAIYGALNQLRIPGFSETNVFDALYDTLDRLDRVEGKKDVILVTTGYDSFSKLTLDQIMKKIKNTKDVTIFVVDVGQILRIMGGGHNRGAGIHASELDYLQADNEMRTFAAMTGGRAYFPRFEGELPELFGDISNDIRNQYSISYHPTNNKLDGTYRKLKVQVVAPDGGQLKVKDQKGKDVKIDIFARDGYTAKHTVD